MYRKKNKKKQDSKRNFASESLDFLRPDGYIKKRKITKIQILKAKKEITEIPIVKADHGYSLCRAQKRGDLIMREYKKPVVTVDAGLAEGIYAASGAAQGTLNVTYYGVWDRWGTNGGKGLAMANWSGINGTITLTINFNDTVDQIETDDASVQTSWSGNTATLTFAKTRK